MLSSFASRVSEYDTISQASTAGLNQQLQPEANIPSTLNLAAYPALYVLPQGLSIDERKEINAKLISMQGDLASSIKQARLILTFAKGAVRAKYDLASERLEDVDRLHVYEPERREESQQLSLRTRKDHDENVEQHVSSSPPNETRRLSDEESDASSVATDVTLTNVFTNSKRKSIWNPTKLAIIKLQWLFNSINRKVVLPLNKYILLEGPWLPRRQDIRSQVLKRKRITSPDDQSSNSPGLVHPQRTKASQNQSKKRVLLSQETTEELEAIEQRPVPEWVRKQTRYSCQRKQTQPTANEDFLAELRLIKHKRLLDEKHSEKIRNSYGRAISSIAAYPYPFLHPSEVQKLPQCGEKFGRLFREFQVFGSLKEADEMRNDAKLQILDLFWNIHGIGPHMAMSLYDKGYRTLDGLRYRVWPSLVELVEDDPFEKARLDSLEEPGLDREQQQGLKFYEDFQERIPRAEVEAIAIVIERHLKQVTDHQAEAMLVGSYRKGKPTSGDVDIVISHPDESMTASLVEKVCNSLDEEGWIRARLKISLAHTHRNQKPVFREHTGDSGAGRGGRGGGASFASLDIALLVWQDIEWLTKEQDIAEDADARNPAICRRVDIIVSPWKSVGCAVLGWSGGITFERDLREYADKELGLKFDSSGVMDRKTGLWVDIEQYDDPATRAKTIAEAERKVIEGMGLECFDPKERLTD